MFKRKPSVWNKFSEDCLILRKWHVLSTQINACVYFEFLFLKCSCVDVQLREFLNE